MSRRRARVLVALAVVLVGAIAVAIWRPGLVLGEYVPALERSLARAADGRSAKCGRERAGVRVCSVPDAGLSGSATWRARARARGCWEGRRVEPGQTTETPQPRHASGCPWLRDYLAGYFFD